jgi:uncharacterized protein YjbI with pentapeptide repeats
MNLAYSCIPEMKAIGSMMQRSKFEDCDLGKSQFKNCDLSGVDFEECRLDGASIDGIKIEDLIKCWQQKHGSVQQGLFK